MRFSLEEQSLWSECIYREPERARARCHIIIGLEFIKYSSSISTTTLKSDSRCVWIHSHRVYQLTIQQPASFSFLVMLVAARRYLKKFPFIMRLSEFALIIYWIRNAACAAANECPSALLRIIAPKPPRGAHPHFQRREFEHFAGWRDAWVCVCVRRGLGNWMRLSSWAAKELVENSSLCLVNIGFCMLWILILHDSDCFYFAY